MIDVNIIKNHQKFYKKIDSLVKEEELTYLEAIVAYCEEQSIEIESIVPAIINNLNLVDRLRQEAENLHYLPKSSTLKELFK